MTVFSITRSLLKSYKVFLFLLCDHTLLSIRVGSIPNTKYIATAVDETHLNMTCTQCSCIAAITDVIGWNCLTNGSQCQLILNYSSSDAGLKDMNNFTFYFRKLPPEPPSTAAQTTTEKVSTIISTLKITTSGATLRWNETFVTVGGIYGSSGTSVALLNKPNGIAIDPTSQSVFVADEEKNRVQKFLPGVTNGTTVAGDAAGNAGSANHELEKPNALTWLNNTGELFIVDGKNNRIMRILTSNTSLVATKVAGVGSDGPLLSEMKEPSGVVVDKNGVYLYVADTGHHRILGWNLMNLTTYGILIAGITDDHSQKNGTLNQPHSLALNQQGTVLFIADKGNNRIQKLVLSTNVITTAAGHANGAEGTDAYGLKKPTGIALDSLDNLYVADKENNRIQMFCNNSLNGTNILPNVIFDSPSGIAIDSSFNLYVSDTEKNRVLKFKPLP